MVFYLKTVKPEEKLLDLSDHKQVLLKFGLKLWFLVVEKREFSLKCFDSVQFLFRNLSEPWEALWRLPVDAFMSETLTALLNSTSII